MPSILIRDISEKTVKHLKARAKQHNRSLQQEVNVLIENYTAHSGESITHRAESIRKRLAAKGKKFSDSAGLIREDRCR